MKKIFTLIGIVTILQGEAQQPKSFHLHKPVNIIAILATKPSLALSFSSISAARSIINDITDASGMQQNFKVISTTQVDNAAAVTYQNQRYILYNASFINQLDNMANDKWASISVLAHEIGHHLLGHTLDGTGSQVPKELAADEFSGVVLHRMGATLQQSQLAMQLVSSPYASATHPAQRDRLVAIAKGWNYTSGQINNNNMDVAIETPVNNGRSNYPTPNNYPGTNTESRSDRRNNYPQYPETRTDRRNYPEGNINNYPDQNYPQYPTTRNDRGSYPATNRNSYPNSRTSGSMGRSTNNTSQSIVYDVRFNRGSSEQYFITSQNNVVKYNGNRILLVAKIAATSRSNYPYIIYDDQTQLYVDRRGTIYSEGGRTVGYITAHS